MPVGTRCRTVFLPAITSVWPALWPPWKRTTPWAWSVSQSTTFPLPSSPHWVPMTTTFLTFLATVSGLAQFAHGPLAGALYELAFALGMSPPGSVSRKRDHDNFAGGPQLPDRCGKPGIARVGRADGPIRRILPHGGTGEVAKVHAESFG